MSEVLWTIEGADFADNYLNPAASDDVVWNVAQHTSHKFSQFHPSQADPEAGYRPHPYTIHFSLAQPHPAYLLEIEYIALVPRLPALEIEVNGVCGNAWLHPAPADEIRVPAGLGTSIYSEGVLRLTLPGELLHKGDNQLVLTAQDDGDFIRIDNIEKVRRLDRLATGAGLVYQAIRFAGINAPTTVARAEIAPTILYYENAQGHLVERCYVFLEHTQAIHGAQLHLELSEGARHEHIWCDVPAVAFGQWRQEFELWDGEGEVAYALRGKLNAQDFEQQGAFKRRRKWKVYVTPQVHTDIGYTHRQWEVAERLCRNIDTALELLKRPDLTSSFNYHLDAAWALEVYLQTRSDERIQELHEAIRNDRITIPSNYADVLTQYAALEDLIRNAEFSESVLRPLGKRPDFMTVVDVPSLTGSLPALLQGAGVKYLAHANNLARGPFRWFGGLHRQSPFYWEGTNGGRVLTWLAKMYCELRKVCGSPPTMTAGERGLQLWLDEYEREDYAPDAVLLYGQEADNTDLDPQPIEFIKQWNETYAYPRLVPSHVSDFFEYVETNFRDNLKTYRGDSGAYWEDGVLSSIVPTMWVRRAQAMLVAAERLEALATLQNDSFKFPQTQFDDAWRAVLLYDEHTWGAFLSARDLGTLLQADQWAVKENFARCALDASARLLHAAASRHSLSWNTNGREVVLYNPHSWRVSDSARIEIGAEERLVDAAGNKVPLRLVEQFKTQKIVEFWADLEGLAYARYTLKPSEQTPKLEPKHEPVLENEFYRLEIDAERGCITSWLDKTLGRELVDASAEWGLGSFLYVRGGEGTWLENFRPDWRPGAPEVLNEFELLEWAGETFAFGQRLVLKGLAPYGELEIEWTLPDNTKRINVQYRYRKQARLQKEAAYIAFPLVLDGAQVLSDSQLGWVNWNADELPGGCKDWLPLQTSILLEHTNADVLIASPDIPLFCIGDIVRGQWSRARDLTDGHIFSYVLNNYWDTNYLEAQGGEITWRYQLTSDATIDRARAFQLGWQARQSLYAQRLSLQEFRDTQPPYESGAGGTLAKIEPTGVVISTIKAARWDKGMIVRLQEIEGKDQRAQIWLGEKKIARAWTTDLLEREQKALPVRHDGGLDVDVPAWGLQTVRVEMK